MTTGNQPDGKIGWALYWLEEAGRRLGQNPDSAIWLESLGECCIHLEELLPGDLGESHFVSSALINAVNDLQHGVQPHWMTPVAAGSASRVSAREKQRRGVLVDSVKGLQEYFGLTERRACKVVLDGIGAKARVPFETLRAWVRSGKYAAYESLVDSMAEKLALERGGSAHAGDDAPPPGSESIRRWLDATRAAYDRFSKLPGAGPRR